MKILIMLLLLIIALLLLKIHMHKRITGGKPSDEVNRINVWDKYPVTFKQTIQKKYSAMLTINDIPEPPETLIYDPAVNIGRTVHIGQLKLLLVEIEFLTKYYNPNRNTLLIYAGSAPGRTQDIINYLFPKLHSFLIDPATHSFDGVWHAIKFEKNMDNIVSTIQKDLNKSNLVDNDQSHNFYILEDLFTDELAIELGSLDRTNLDILFMSDIRTRINTERDYPTNLDILWNSSQQYNWVNFIKPNAYSLKFHPYYNFDPITMDEKYSFILKDLETSKKFGIDFLDDYDHKKFRYLDSDIYLQAYPGEASSEIRFTGHSINIKEYDIKKLDSKLFYYNLFIRMFGLHDNIIRWDEHLGIDGCGDCSLMCKIIENYISRRIIRITFDDLLDKIMEFLTKFKNDNKYEFTFNIYNHGMFRKPFKLINNDITASILIDLTSIYKTRMDIKTKYKFPKVNLVPYGQESKDND